MTNAENTGGPEQGPPAAGTWLRVRLHDRPGALERFIGQVRRRQVPVQRLSIATASDGTFEIVLRIDPARASLDRVTAELQTMPDIVLIEAAGDAELETRELVLVRVPGTADVPPVGRVLYQAEHTMIEITGAPADIDAALRVLLDSGVTHGFVRSGELAMPRTP